jgi:hypothetical protein
MNVDDFIVEEPDKTFTVRVPPFLDEGYKSRSAAKKQAQELLSILKRDVESDTVPAITKKMVEEQVSYYSETHEKTYALMILAVAKHFKLITGTEYYKLLKKIKG